MLLQAPQRKEYKFSVLWHCTLITKPKGEFQSHERWPGGSCSLHDITKVCLHYNQHGAAATASDEKQRQCEPVQNSWPSLFSSSYTAKNVQKGLLQKKQLTARERRDLGLMIFLVVEHSQFFT